MPAPPRTIEDAWRASKSVGDNFGAIRFAAATLVIFSHAFEMGAGSRADEPLERLSGQISFGEAAVLVFFAVSGFLIAKSWTSDPHLRRFARKRALRIMPALLFCVSVIGLVAGPLLTVLPVAEYFVRTQTACFLLNAALISRCASLPGVFEGTAINAPLWTLAFEASCYALIALLGVMRALRPGVCAGLALALICALGPLAQSAPGSYAFKFALLAPAFLMGAAAAMAAGRIPLNGRLAALCAVLLGGSVFWGDLTIAFALSGVYLVIWLAFAPLGAWACSVGRRDDYSYGLYLWGWPVQMTIAAAIGGGAAINFALSFPIALCFAVASWRLVEKPAIAAKVATLAPKRVIPMAVGDSCLRSGGRRLAASAEAAEEMVNPAG